MSALVYFDSSAFVKLLVEEEESEVAAALWDGCDAALSSQLAYAEVRAALAAAQRDHRMSRRQLRTVNERWTDYWDSTRHLDVGPDIARAAGQLAEEKSLRGADAVHLASLLAVGVDTCIMATWDQRLRIAAEAVGARTAP